jgi:hypothetical protein
MAKKIQTVVLETHFQRESELSIDNHTIAKGDLIKVKGEYGVRFKFDSFVTNTKTGATWIDCFEVYRGTVGAYRSFKSDRIKRIPKKRVKKNVNRRSTSTAS